MFGVTVPDALRAIRWRWVAMAMLALEPALHLFGIPHPELGQQALNLLATVEPSDG